MAAWKLSLRAEMVFRRQVPPAQVPALKNSAFESMTRLVFIAQPSAEPERYATCRDTRKIGKTIEP